MPVMDAHAWTVADHLRGQPPESVALYRRFVEIIDSFGPYEVTVAKTTITFKGPRRGFAGARPTAQGVTAYMDLQRPVSHRCIHHVAPYTKRLFVHHLRITSSADFDDELIGYLREAYEVGEGAHITGR
jgi:Domain of unknown function (DUF5655)